MRLARRLCPIVLVIGGVVTFGATSPAAAQSDVDDPALIEEGAVIYETNCAGCHGPDGEGTGFGRSLIGIAEQEPDRAVHLASVANGVRNMPEFASSLDDGQIDAVVSYVRLAWAPEPAREELPETGGTLTAALVGATLIGLGLSLDQLATRRRASTA